jgi:hypothetical protein
MKTDVGVIYDMDVEVFDISVTSGIYERFLIPHLKT